MRQFPLFAARRLGRATRLWRGFPLVYIFIMFVIVPLFFLGLSALFEEDTKGFKVLGSFLVIVLVLILAYLTYWCLDMDGREKCTSCIMARERKRVAMKELPDDMDYLKARVAALTEHTGLVVEDEDDDEDEDVAVEAEEDEPMMENKEDDDEVNA